LPANDPEIDHLQASLSISRVICTMLVQRNIRNFQEAKTYFRPSLQQLHSPWLMKDMDKAVDRLLKAFETKEKILVFGDYDVDGTTAVAEGKEIRNFNGKDYLLEYAFNSDFALVKAWKGDTDGNLLYRDTARNFNPLMAMAGKITIAEVEELVAPGELDPNNIHTPGIYVHRIFQGANYEKRIEQRTVNKKKEA